jgi:phosphatidylserine/phosphatidylglycerophosphate/cardiolipin synthase-like enzyme
VVLATAAGGTVPTSRAHGRAQAASGLGAVIVEPSELGSSAGITAVYDFVLSAKKSVDMTMYELVDPAMVRDLVADDKRHVKVRVILDTNREQSRNGPAFRTLRAGGVKVVWADTSYEATHQKTITVDGTESLFFSAKLTQEYY